MGATLAGKTKVLLLVVLVVLLKLLDISCGNEYLILLLDEFLEDRDILSVINSIDG